MYLLKLGDVSTYFIDYLRLVEDDLRFDETQVVHNNSFK